MLFIAVLHYDTQTSTLCFGIQCCVFLLPPQSLLSVFFLYFLPTGSYCFFFFFFSSRRRHTRCSRDWSSDVCSSDLHEGAGGEIYVVAEKILAPGEQLPDSWATAGTTGYEFLNLLNGIFVDRAQARAMEQNYARLIRHRPGFTEIVHDCKRLIMETSMAAELNMLAHRLNAISEKHRTSRDFTLGALTRALREVIAAFPVYRTYVTAAQSPPDRRAPEAAEGAPTANTGVITDRDREYVRRAVAHARRQVASADASSLRLRARRRGRRRPHRGAAPPRAPRL